jgi:hypothetical protein
VYAFTRRKRRPVPCHACERRVLLLVSAFPSRRIRQKGADAPQHKMEGKDLPMELQCCRPVSLEKESVEERHRYNR